MTQAGLVVLISGNGSNLQAILDAISTGELPAEVRAVISNKKDAYGLERARKAGVPAVVKSRRSDQNRAEYDTELANLVAGYQPDLIVLAGWMRLLTLNFLGRFPGRVINLHPALPGMFPGVDAIERAYEAYHRGEIKYTGIMVHYVPDEGVDIGPIINQQIVEIRPSDTLEELEMRVHACEHELLVKTIQQLINQMEEEDA
ncbi:phosphoribosylglycinamide formyltransferase [Leptolinea tardivitalis]|uniref:Phosphoribosylglycinamide formyltransferase n=1 Tax=Leptolinea tardivitalis TaxID=229920 RepID=A0A0P6WXI7_9CHLR|nr:phosphoribosylglycinamide formyltransferase [Leptolinea tardivitalis]KPL71157.1 phosphoribosylglycinamide formyltransferase [Leptolinea tardivitalis]GAP22595.1 phosphoribosylglycinamide formyltransferase, formyltetrahydrofolate-dependent [Leptolinea tardivitalis]